MRRGLQRIDLDSRLGSSRIRDLHDKRQTQVGKAAIGIGGLMFLLFLGSLAATMFLIWLGVTSVNECGGVARCLGTMVKDFDEARNE